MRIISINVHYQDKLGYQDYFLGRELKNLGHEVHFVTSDKHFDYPDYDRTVKHIIGDKDVGTGIFYNDYDVPVHRLKGTSKKRTGLIWLKGFKEKLLELKPDFIISHGVFTYQSIRLLYFAKKLNCPIVFDDHTTINLVRKSLSSNIVYFVFRLFFSRKFLRVSHKIVGISETCIDVLKNNFGLRGTKVEMIPLGTDIDLFRKNINLRIAYRQELNVAQDEILIAYTGKIYGLKNAHLIIDALNDDDVVAGKKIKILFVGDIAEDYQEFFQNKINESKNSITLKKAVSVEDLVRVYNAADICVWPDHLTTSTIDASACGCAVICSEYMPERVKYKNGLLVKAGNLLDLKEKLNFLIINKLERSEMGMKGIEYVKNELSWNAIATRFIDI